MFVEIIFFFIINLQEIIPQIRSYILCIWALYSEDNIYFQINIHDMLQNKLTIFILKHKFQIGALMMLL